MLKLICSILLLPILLSAQTKISGSIFDSGNQPLPGANVFIKDTYDGVSSNQDGSFSFETEEKGEAVLVVSFVGYNNYEKSIYLDGTPINLEIILEDNTKELRTVVISAGAFEASDEKKGVILRPLDVLTTGSEADIYSTLETLPGTQQIGETEGLFVRGGAASEAVTIVDEMVVQKPFYTSVPDIPSRGRFSPMLFKGTIFSTGGYSAQYGQALSSALILRTTDLAEETTTALNFMALGLGAAHTHRWENSSVAVEGGYYNLAPYFNVVEQNSDWEKAPVGIESSFNYRVKTSETGIVKAFGSYSYGDLSLNMEDIDNPGNKTSFGIRSDNYYVNLNYREILGDDWTIFTGASFSYDLDKINISADKVKQDEQLAQTKVTVTKGITDNSFLTFGGEIHNSIYNDSFNNLSAGLNEVYTAGFVEADIFFTNDIAARVGLRGENSKLLNKLNLAPRISLAYRLGKYDQLNFAYGKFYQTPHKDYLYYSTDYDYENAEHYIVNYQLIGPQRTFRIELYYKDYSNLAKGSTQTYPVYNLPPVQFNNDGKGYAKGIDIFWRDQETIDYVDYWISYSYLDTKRDFSNYPQMAFPTFATPHTLSFVFKFWVPSITTYFATTYSFSTGRPYFNPNNPEFLGDRGKNYNNLSFNFSHITTIFNSFTVIFASIDNVLGFRNIYSYRYSWDGAIKRPVVPESLRSFFIGCFISIGEDNPYN
ncbi:MAG: TonB-dependent receptor [Melioribacteraceae bacterium]|nr:TonB-dependent receptor [Melioribacteraceae bacterium]MCF8355248.1 TonB-dependent receptor [Melioribacteraceae bacterium]MCF8395562.1 TonB-dependent receptor [Melioribacteraceae bacterium]MCF8420862.1 TonB-dependent receptor [Melioribacteraceae bacterium]